MLEIESRQRLTYMENRLQETILWPGFLFKFDSYSLPRSLILNQLSTKKG